MQLPERSRGGTVAQGLECNEIVIDVGVRAEIDRECDLIRRNASRPSPAVFRAS